MPVDLLLYYALPMTGFALAMWQRRRGRRALPAELRWDEPVDIALAVALHEAGSRDEDAHPIHLFYGLLQDETVEAAIAMAGADTAEIESAVLDALDMPEARAPQQHHDVRLTIEGRMVLGTAVALGGERRAGVVELWTALQKDAQMSAIVRASGIQPAEVLFALVHGAVPEGPSGAQKVELFLINDHVTPMELVVEILKEDFNYAQPDALRLMLQTHTEGEASLGSFAVGPADCKRTAAHERARENDSPLLIRWRAVTAL